MSFICASHTTFKPPLYLIKGTFYDNNHHARGIAVMRSLGAWAGDDSCALDVAWGFCLDFARLCEVF
jgi:hypothetical protein